MNYKPLLTYVTLVDEGSFTSAAKKLFMTQPAVSWQIKALEQDIGVLLIHRNQKDFETTEAGKALYKHAKIILNQYAMLEKDMAQFLEGSLSTLRIATSTLPGEYLMPKQIAQFKSQYGNLTVHMDIGDSKETIERVLNGEVDLGIVGLKPETNDLEALPFKNDALKLVCAIDYPLPQALSLKDLMNEPLILREEGSGTRDTIIEFLVKNNQKPVSQMILGSSKAIVTAIEAQMGISWVSEHAIADALALKKMRVVDEKYDIKRHFYIITKKKRSLAPTAEAFKAFLLEQS